MDLLTFMFVFWHFRLLHGTLHSWETWLLLKLMPCRKKMPHRHTTIFTKVTALSSEYSTLVKTFPCWKQSLFGMRILPLQNEGRAPWALEQRCHKSLQKTKHSEDKNAKIANFNIFSVRCKELLSLRHTVMCIASLVTKPTLSIHTFTSLKRM